MSGGKLWVGPGPSQDIYIQVSGSSLVCDGIIGNGGTFDYICFAFEGASCAITGIGFFDASRIRKNTVTATTTSLTISRDVNLRFTGSVAADIYNNTGAASATASNFNVTVSSGATLTCIGGASIDGPAGGFTNNAGGIFTINGTMILGGRLYLTNDNTTAAQSCKWIVNGRLKADRIVATTSGAAKDSLIVNSGDTLEISGDSAFVSISNALNNNFYSFVSGSYVFYSSSGNQTVRGTAGTELGASTSYGNLILSGGGTKTLSSGTSLRTKNNFTISSPVVFTSASASPQIQIGGNWTNWNASGFTEQTSTVQFNGTAGQSITCTGGEVFNNLTYQQSSATAKNTLTFNCAVDVKSVFAQGSDSSIVDLNSNTLTIRSSAFTAIDTTGRNSSRYIISEKTDNSSKLKWQIGTTASPNLVYVFPFGKSNGEYIPDTITAATSGATMGDVTISTYATPASNLPWPTSPVAVTNLYSAIPVGNDSDAVVNRFWEIDATGGGTADISLTYSSSELPVAPYNVQSQIAGQWYHPASNTWQLPAQGTANGYTVTIPGNAHYGPWTLVNTNALLPITLLEFNAVLRKNVVDVTWSTASEINNDFFTVEKSKDGKQFEGTGKIKGAGNSSVTLHYSFPDYHPFPGLSYYRLKQTDFDGHASYSRMVPVMNKSDDTFSLFPNPSKDIMYLASGGKGAYTLLVKDIQGKVIQQQFLEMNPGELSQLNISSLPQGIYLLEIKNEYINQVIKLIKN